MALCGLGAGPRALEPAARRLELLDGGQRFGRCPDAVQALDARSLGHTVAEALSELVLLELDVQAEEALDQAALVVRLHERRQAAVAPPLGELRQARQGGQTPGGAVLYAHLDRLQV